jgi:hypothetical protein
MVHTIREMLKGLGLPCEVSMLRINTNNSHSEHDLFLRLFLTSGGGW